VAEDNVVVDILVEGNEALSDSAVLHHVRSRIGQRYDRQVVEADEKRLLATGRFRSVRAYAARRDGGVMLTFEVEEHPTIGGITFRNNKAFKARQLTRDMPYAVGDPLSEFTVEAGRKAILATYHDGGYRFAQVTARVDGREVIYEIVEGPKIAVRAVKFEGNTHLPTARLRAVVQTSAMFWPVQKHPLDEEQVERDMQALRRLFVDEGFLGAEVSRRLEYNEDKSQVTVVFVIAQHVRYRISRIQFEGNVVFNDEQLLQRMQLQVGDFLEASRLRQDLDGAREAYGQIGYIDAEVDSRIVYVDPEAPAPAYIVLAADEGLVQLTIVVVEHDQYFIGQVTIRGNAVTQERVIRRALHFYPEQVFDSVAVGKARQRLMETRLFEDVSITPLAATDHTRNVLVEVSEAQTGQFLLGAGVSTNSGLLGNITYVERNFDLFGWGRSPRFKGGGQELRVVAEPGTELMRFHVAWFDPAMFDQPYSMGVKAFLFQRGREEYDELRGGQVVSVGRRFLNDWYGEIANRIEFVTISGVDSGSMSGGGSSSMMPSEITDAEGGHTLMGFKGTLVRDRTDSRWMPTTGDRVRFAYEQVVGSSIFGRAEVEHRIYRTVYVDALDRKHVIAARTMVGQIVGDAPVFERYYGGGIGSIRGFEYRGVSPRSGGSDSPIGGDFILLTSGEYQFPLVGETLRGVIFVDTGTVEDTTGLSSLRASIGTGLRWVVPMMGPVPISLDFAIPLAKGDGDQTQIFSFFLGWTF